jgi:hypothetical protein
MSPPNYFGHNYSICFEVFSNKIYELAAYEVLNSPDELSRQ